MQRVDKRKYDVTVGELTQFGGVFVRRSSRSLS